MSLLRWGSSVDVDVVKVGVGERLASYMVPSQFVVLDAFPLNASGKLDRKLLPEPVFEAAVFRAPVTAAEEIVASVFAEVLGVERVGLDDDFFALGGNSLIATRVGGSVGAGARCAGSGAGVVRGVVGGVVGCAGGVGDRFGCSGGVDCSGASGAGAVVVGAAADVVLEPFRYVVVGEQYSGGDSVVGVVGCGGSAGCCVGCCCAA